MPPNTFELITHSEDETRQLGAIVGKLAEPGQVIALLGDLGAGKTRFVQGFGASIGVPATEIINSPTFTLINQYQGHLTCYHIDLYRLTNAPEIETLGLDDLLYGEGVCLIEWADRLEDDLLTDRLEVELHHLSDTERRITIRAFGAEYAAQLKKLRELWTLERSFHEPAARHRR